MSSLPEGPARTEPVKNIMVCVTGQRSCERLVIHGAKRRLPEQKLFIVHCVQTGRHFLNSIDESNAIEYLFGAACAVGAELTILKEDNVVSALAGFARMHNVGTIVLGVSPDNSKESFTSRFYSLLPEVEFDVVG